ncbi:ligand-dependent corepressor [Rana temporaria]|uniref:ligand-dependent corepressor n=1 Tax=Rana temporaria TaxID=8407 RepID=UPI001AAD68C6|nr:ligand-dependent corepressor [Rana temporaria]
MGCRFTIELAMVQIAISNLRPLEAGSDVMMTLPSLLDIFFSFLFFFILRSADKLFLCILADGVLDLSTKKSPCSGSTHSTISPSTSNAIGNGTQKTEGKAVDPCNSTSLTLEKFMVKLCAHHQKQFILVLNSLCTEELFVNSKSQSASILDVKTANVEDGSHCVPDRCTREMSIQPTSIEASIDTASVCADVDNFPKEEAQTIEILRPPVQLGVSENPVAEITFFQKCSHSTNQEENIAKNHILHLKPAEENSKLLQSVETECSKKTEPLQTEFSDCCVLAHSNLKLTPVTGAQEAEFLINLPKCADKENPQCVSPRQTILEKGGDCKLKQNSVQAVVTKLGNHLNPYESFQTLSENSVASLHKIRSHESMKHSKTAKRCKNIPSLRKSDCDNQCDVVYISEPIAAQYHFATSGLCSRSTARKSTRGYLFNDECYQLSAVRSLVRSVKVEDKGNCALHFSEALITPDGVNTETLPLTDIVSLEHSEETCMSIGTGNSLPQNIILDPPILKESSNADEISGMVEQSVTAKPDSLLAVFSVTHENPSFSGTHPANENLQKKLSEITVKQEDIPMDVGNIHEEKLPSEVAYASASVNEEKNATLDAGLTVSLEDETLLSDLNNVKEVASNDLFSQEPTVKQNHAPFENPSVSPSISCSVFPPSSEIENGGMAPTTPNCFPCQTISKTLESSVTMSERLELSPAHLSSDTVANGLVEKSFEDLSFGAVQKNSDYSNHVNILGEDITEKTVKDSSVVTSPKKTEHFHKVYEEQYSDKCSVHVESVELKNVETAEPSDVINCSKTENHVDRISAEDVHRLIDTCAKICEPSDIHLKDGSITKQDVQQCPSVTSFERENNGNEEKSLQTKEINGEMHSNGASLDMLDSLFPSDDKIPSPSKRKLKKPLIPSDRHLRRRESQSDECTKKQASLHIQISPFSSTKSSRRSVEFSTECAAQLTKINANFEESLEDKNCIVQVLSDQFDEGKALLSERMFKNTISSPQKKVENVSVNFEISSDQRKVYLCSEIKKCIKVEVEESSGSQGSLNYCSFEVEKGSKQVPAPTSPSLARTRSKTKCVALNPLTEHEEKPNKANLLDHLSEENEKKPIVSTNTKRSLRSSKGKEMFRPKFMDWCFEEESQQRISSFNTRYSSVHNNWISVERDATFGSKSKNKADKLKEIWKSKKRVRKTRTPEETQRCSPVQMLFMNSFKLSDICRWFLETTETKSLVIVKKINTRIPEEHQLPVPPIQKYSKQSLYPYTLQAERLKKYLKKFASVYPARNDAETQNALGKLDNKAQLAETSKISVKGAGDSRSSGAKVHANKSASAHILRKRNNFQEKLHPPSAPLNKKHKAAKMQNSGANSGIAQNNKKTNSQTAVVCKLLVTDEKQKARKRPKDDRLEKDDVPTSKRRKTEIKQEPDKNRQISGKNALPTTKKTDRKVERTEAASKLRAPKKQEVKKAQAGKAASLKKGKTKTAMQNKSVKTPLAVRKCQTRSSKLRPAPPVLSEQRITRASQPWMKEFHRKSCSGSKTASKTPLLEKRKSRSQTDSSSTQSRR